MSISATQAYYIKLGETGKWESDCVTDGYMRVGFSEIPHELCVAGKWDEVKKNFHDNGKVQGSETLFSNQLKLFYETPAETLWITFFDRKLWWGFAEGEVFLDSERNKNRKIKWQSKDAKDVDLNITWMSSRLTQVKGYRGTICKVKELEYLLRKINGEILPEVQKAKDAKVGLLSALMPLIQQRITEQDFEILVDMIFTAGGWRRIGDVGKTEKDIDLELQQPVTGELVMVQVKSKCSPHIIREISDKNLGKNQYKQIFVVVHSFEGKLPVDGIDERLQIIGVDQLALLTLNAGLADWLIEKSK